VDEEMMLNLEPINDVKTLSKIVAYILGSNDSIEVIIYDRAGAKIFFYSHGKIWWKEAVIEVGEINDKELLDTIRECLIFMWWRYEERETGKGKFVHFWRL